MSAITDKHLNDFFSYLKNERRYSVHTLKNYQRDLNHFQQFISAEDVSEWSQVTSHHLRAFSALRHRKGLSGKSIQRELSATRSFYTYLLRESVVQANPVMGVSAPKSPRKPILAILYWRLNPSIRRWAKSAKTFISQAQQKTIPPPSAAMCIVLSRLAFKPCSISFLLQKILPPAR